MMFLITAAFLTCFLLVPSTICAPTVEIQGIGTIVGTELLSRENRTIHSFQGIPFAESPTGERRFQAPVPRKWNGNDTIDATKPGIKCIQPSLVQLKRLKRSLWDAKDSTIKADDPEDCLLISVYKPAEPTSKETLPVMMFVHGGSFIEGSASRFTPEFLLDRDIILVVPQYRLGPFGYMSLQNNVIPGNAGLMDVVESLKWVKNYISNFGGNPEKVTIFGQSAGAAIATYLMLSPVTKGLFHGVIANSGTAIATWAIDTDPVKHATEISMLAGCRGNAEELGLCMQEASPNTIMRAFLTHSYAEQASGGAALGGSLPVISRADEPDETKVVPEHPQNAMEKNNYNHLPFLIGANRHDAMFLVNLINDYVLKPNNYTEDEDYLKYVFPQFLTQSSGARDATLFITDMMEDKYFGHVSESDRGNFTKLLPGVLDFYTTSLFKAPAHRMLQLNAMFTPSYLYSFNYKGRFHIPENGIDPGGLFSEGVAHSDDMIYLTPRLPVTFNEEELQLSKMLVDFWVNFAATGLPNFANEAKLPLWLAYEKEEEYYLDINVLTVTRQHYTKEYTAAILDVTSTSRSNTILPGAVCLLISLIICLY